MKFKTKYQKSFKKRMLVVLYYSILFSSAIAIIAFILNESFDNQVTWGRLFEQILLCNLLFGLPIFLSLYKSNRFLIKKLSIEDNYIFLEYYDYNNNIKLKHPLERIRIELEQWRNTNSLYLKITANNVKIKQYRGGAWSADNLREVFKALKEAQKNFEVEPE